MVERNDYSYYIYLVAENRNPFEKIYGGEKMDHFPQGIGVKIVKKYLKFHHRFEERVLIFRLGKKHLGRNTKRLQKTGVPKAYLMLQVSKLGIYF